MENLHWRFRKKTETILVNSWNFEKLEMFSDYVIARTLEWQKN